MGACRTLIQSWVSSCTDCSLRTIGRTSFSSLFFPPRFLTLRSPSPGYVSLRVSRKLYTACASTQLDVSDYATESILDEQQSDENYNRDTVEQLLNKTDDVSTFMKMERRPEGESRFTESTRWFPYLNEFRAGDVVLNSDQVLESVDSYIMESRKSRFVNAVNNRSYAVCLVVEGLSDFGNVSAVFRSADALGIQSLHVVSCNSSKRYRENRHVSMGAEKWLDIELWDSTKECFEVLKSRGYRIATTHVGMDAVSVHDMDWTCPTAIVLGNEKRGISDEALSLSDLHCSIPMRGMVDSFNVSVAAGILMYHAVCDRTSRMGFHGDLTPSESKILLAEFSLRHSRSALSIAHEYAKRKVKPTPKL